VNETAMGDDQEMNYDRRLTFEVWSEWTIANHDMLSTRHRDNRKILRQVRLLIYSDR